MISPPRRLLLTFGLLIVGQGVVLTRAAEAPTRIADYRALSREVAAQALPVRVRGVVTWQDKRGRFTVQDDTAGVYVNVAEAQKRKIWQGDDSIVQNIHEGLELEIEAISDPGGYAPVLLPRNLRALGEKPLPRARPTEPTRFYGGAEASQRIEVRGVISGFEAVSDYWVLRMNNLQGTFTVEATRAAVPNPKELVDAEVRVRGVGASGFNTHGELTNVRLLVGLSGDVIVEKPAMASPFDAPLIPLDGLMAFRAEPVMPHRIRVQGTVTCAVPGLFFFLQEDSRVVRVETRSDVQLKVGDRVEAAGFAEMVRRVGVLGGAEVRVVGAQSVPPASAINPEAIMALDAAASFTGQAPQPHDYDGHLIRFRARLLGRPAALDEKPTWRRLTLEQGNMVIGAILYGDKPEALDALQSGSMLEVIGIVQLEYAPISQIRQSFRPVRLDVLLRSAGDVTVVRAPSWWTVQRLLGVLAIGMLAFGGALLWVWQLRQQVQRKAQELAVEIHARRDAAIEFQATLRERSRLAANLHDTLLQTIGGIGFTLEACRADSAALGSDGKLGANLEMARRMLDHAEVELRGSVWALRSVPMSGMELPEVLRSLAQRASIGQRAKVVVLTDGNLPKIPDFVAGNLVLAAQEALHNALKHGNPKAVEVEVRLVKPGWVSLIIRDDGAGFSPGSQAGAADGHFGLAGIHERMERLGGITRIESAPGRGTTVSLEVPLRSYDEDVA